MKPIVLFLALATVLSGRPALRAGESKTGICESAAAAAAGRDPWTLKDTANFCVCCPRGMDASAIGRTCETLRAALGKKWLGKSSDTTWTSRCYVVVHPSIASYLREVGEAGRATLGSSLIKTERGKVISRRIDIRGDVADPLAASLPHEMTHVVLADEFPSEELPRWADEGMAMQADPTAKLAAHEHDLENAIAGGTLFRMPELLNPVNYPSGARRAVFYAQSASLVRFLVAQQKPTKFVEFVHLAASQGYATALRESYGVKDLAQLERAWRSRPELALK